MEIGIGTLSLMHPDSGIGRQAHPAEKLNISREHLSRIERGKYGCSIDLLIELSYTLNASTDYLLLGRNPDRDQDRKQLLQVIRQLSDIARNM